MYSQFESYSEVVPLLVLLFGGVAGYRTGQLVYRRSGAAMRGSTRWVRILLALAALSVLGEIYLGIRMAAFGMVFGGSRLIVAAPPMVLALVGTGVLTMPRMRRFDRLTRDDPDAVSDAELRRAAGDPRIVVPVQAVGIAGLLAFYTVFVGRPVPPFTLDAVEANGLLIVAAALLWLRQSRRRRLLGGPDRRTSPGFGVRLLRTAGALVVIGAVLIGAVLFYQGDSKLPGSYDMGASQNVDYGGGPAAPMAMDTGQPTSGATSVSQLTGGAEVKGTPDDTFTLTARAKRVALSSGRLVDAWTYNGQVPGPELRVHDGDLVQVTLVNTIPGIGVTIHWHGLDVPNAEDGVPGVTQNAVRTGQSFVYRFRVHQVGTFWYHSHQDAVTEVDRGLFGAFVVLPKNPQAGLRDITVAAHDWKMLNDTVTLGNADVLSKQAVSPGTPVRLRLINTGTYAVDDKLTATYVLTGTTFKVAAIDGTDLHQPGDLRSGTNIRIGSGGRTDLTFTMPDHPVRLTDLDGPANGLVLSKDGTATAPAPSAGGPLFDPGHYGTPAPTPFNAASHFDRQFTTVLDDGPGFYDGGFEFRLTINGRVFPDTPMLMVRQGDLVKVTLIDRGHTNHPFHLHGHHALVLSHNGQPITGSPWWTDTLEVRTGDIYEIAFRADNPGIWMDHCHNLQHASKGMIMHLGYEGVTEPYRTGPATGNTPE